MGNCNLGSCTHGLSPICLPYVQFQPNVITCPNLEFTPIESPLCDFLPTISSLPDFLTNLPFLMLFVVSFPARFLYCMTYEFLANADEFLEIIIYYILYPFIDFITLPFLYFVLGFNNGLVDNFSLPSQLYGFLNACFISQILKKVYSVLGDVFYIIGFGIGFISALFIKFFNLLIDIPCYLAYLTLCFGFGICVGIEIPVINYTISFSNCVSACFQPFEFLQNLICTFLNCGCALGTCPTIAFNIGLPIGNCNPDQKCYQSNLTPMCIQYNLNPIQNQGSVYTSPVISPNNYTKQSNSSSSTNNQSETEPSNETSEYYTSETMPYSETTSPNESSEYYTSETEPPNETMPSSESSEYYTSETNPCYAINELYYCQECLSENINCDLCADVLDTIKQNNCLFPCCNYPCLISNACHLCSECSECSEQFYENACTICNTVLSQCYANQSYTNLPCYSELVYLVSECFTTNNSEICSEAISEYNYCKILKAESLCPPIITSENEMSESEYSSKNNTY